MSAGVSVAGTVVHFVEAVKLLGVSCVTLDSALTFNQHVTDVVRERTYHTRALCHIVKGLTKISKIFAFSVPFCKFSSILHRTPNSAQGGRFCAKFCAQRILTSLGERFIVDRCAMMVSKLTLTRIPDPIRPTSRVPALTDTHIALLVQH